MRTKATTFSSAALANPSSIPPIAAPPPFLLGSLGSCDRGGLARWPFLTFTTSSVLAMPFRYNRYTFATKLRILDAARTGADWEAVAESNGVNINTARFWLRRYPTRSAALHAPLDGGERAQLMALPFSCPSSLSTPISRFACSLDELERSCSILVCPQTVKTKPSRCKSGHDEEVSQRAAPQHMNTEQNKIKRRDFLVRLQQLQAVGKSIGYMDETNFNLWSSRTRGRSASEAGTLSRRCWQVAAKTCRWLPTSVR